MTTRNVLGLMSGTSMDGVDVALLATDGETVGEFGPTLYVPYEEKERSAVKATAAEARVLSDRTARPGALAEAERIVTAAHEAAIAAWRQENPSIEFDLIGFHGQTVFHAPEHRLTVQLGDGPALAARFAVPVVYDFRAADVAAGGEGAPFVPVYHRALVARAGLVGRVVIANIGGVANITRIGEDGVLLAGDTGPGNALIDDLVRTRTGAPFDCDGALAAKGTVDRAALAALMANPWFDTPFPKSLDRDAFSLGPVNGLSDEDGAATLAAFTAKTIAAGIEVAGGADTIVVVGGGTHNPVILRMLAAATGVELLDAASLGWKADFIEAQAFAYLAARSLMGLPLSFPETTGVPYPMPGGTLAQPRETAARPS
jgi:anhydro-N-acetylmuramic acid kinase